MVVFEHGKVQYEQGIVKIYATAENGDVAEYDIRVSDAPVSVQKVSLSSDKLAMGAGETKDDNGGYPANLMDKRVTWSSSDTAVAEVRDAGLTVYELCQAEIIGRKAGTAVITAECRRRFCAVRSDGHG